MQLMHDVWDAARATEPDLVIYHPKALAGPLVAEKLGVPAVLAIPVPIAVATAEFPMMGMPRLPWGAGYNRLTYRITELGYRSYDKWARAFRSETPGLDGPARALTTTLPDGRPVEVLHAISSHVVPRPADWPDHAHLTGYWFLDAAEEWTPPRELRDFLDAGDPPVYVGFGSMAGRDPARMTRIVVEALQLAGVRGIAATGWGGMNTDDLPDTVLSITEAPHDWIFPRVAAVVHHGGAGTTAAGLRAGRPTVICPFIIDQFFWGARVESSRHGPGADPAEEAGAGQARRRYLAGHDRYRHRIGRCRPWPTIARRRRRGERRGDHRVRPGRVASGNRLLTLSDAQKPRRQIEISR